MRARLIDDDCGTSESARNGFRLSRHYVTELNRIYSASPKHVRVKHGTDVLGHGSEGVKSTVTVGGEGINYEVSCS